MLSLADKITHPDLRPYETEINDSLVEPRRIELPTFALRMRFLPLAIQRVMVLFPY